MRQKSLFNSVFFQITFSLSIIAAIILDFYFKINLNSRVPQQGLINISGLNSLVSMFINVILFAIISFGAIYVGRKYKLIERNKPYSMVFFLLSYLYLNVLLGALNAIIPGLLLVVLFGLFLQIYNQPSVQKLIFYSSVIVSIASFFDLIFSIYLPVLLLGVFIIRPFSIKDFLISIIAFLLPFIYYTVWLFLDNQPPFDLPTIEFNFQQLTVYNWIGISTLGIVIIQSFISRSKMIAHQRNQMSFMVLISLLSLALGLLYNQDFLFLAVIPSAYFASNFYKSLEKRWLIDSILLLLFLLHPLLKFI